MRWIRATGINNEPVYINMAAVQTMMRAPNGKSTMLYLGGMALREMGEGPPQVHYANTQVLESPEQLLAMPVVDPATIDHEVPVKIAAAKPPARRARG